MSQDVELSGRGKAFMLATVFGLSAALFFTLNNPLWSDPESAKKALEDHKFTHIQMKGYAWFSGRALWKGWV